jgi:hypothetical protein
MFFVVVLSICTRRQRREQLQAAEHNDRRHGRDDAMGPYEYLPALRCAHKHLVRARHAGSLSYRRYFRFDIDHS